MPPAPHATVRWTVRCTTDASAPWVRKDVAGADLRLDWEAVRRRHNAAAGGRKEGRKAEGGKEG